MSASADGQAASASPRSRSRPDRAGGPVRLLVALLTIAPLAVLAGACSGDDDASSSSWGSSDSTTGSTTTETLAADGGVRLVDLGLGADQPIDLAFRPASTSLLVAERAGTVREAVADEDGFRLADDPVLDITDAVGDAGGEKGLLGLAVDPDGEHLYVSYTRAQDGASRIDEYELTGDDGSLRAELDTRRQLVAIPQPYANHNGGALRFGSDAMLYAGFGDGGSGGDPEGNGQARDTLLGKILRIDPSAPDGVPSDNPFVDGDGTGTDVERLIWATGLRNPWRIDIDPTTGDLWIGDVGQDRFEEIDRLSPEGGRGAGYGTNLGWDLFEGDQRFDEPDPAPGAASGGPFADPIATYSHDEGCSITGGLVVRDPRLVALDGTYLFSDFCQRWIRGVVTGDGPTRIVDVGLDIGSVAAFARGPSGEVYVVSLDDGVQRLDPA